MDVRSPVNLRKAVAHEIVLTEASYGNSLANGVEIGKELLSPILTPEEMTLLFSNLEEISNLSKNFHRQIKPLLVGWNEVSLIGPLFIDFIPSLDIYMEYIPNFPAAQNFYDTLITESRFKNIENEFFSDPRMTKMTSIISILICPVSRIPRYSLLVKELIKGTPNTHPDFDSLGKADLMLSELAEQINKEVSKSGF